MELIPRNIVESVWIHTNQLTYDDVLKLKDKFEENQPQLFQFLVKFTDHISQEAIELTFHYAMITWQIFIKAFPESVNEITSEQLYCCIEEREKWLEKLNNFSYQEIDQLISKNETIPQSNILSYALEIILEEGEDNLDFNTEDQSYLFWLLIIVVDAFDKVTS